MTGSKNANNQTGNKGKLKPRDKLTLAEQRLLDEYHGRKRERHDAPIVKLKHIPNKPPEMALAGDNPALALIALCNACGTTSLDFETRLVNDLISAACSGNNQEAAINGVIAAMHGIAPRDETEGMLAAQMIATHVAAMRLMNQLGKSESIPQQDSNGNLAVKLLRTYTAQMEALNRYRGKGQQRVTVEHVHVHAGGQAIVGNVSHPGGGAAKKTEEQPHAKRIDHAPVQTMPCQNAQQEPVPVPGDA